MSAGRIGLVAAVLVVVVAVVAGLVISGSPGEQRLLRADETRVGDLQRISNSLQRYFLETGELPDDLNTLVNGWISAGIPVDPATEDAYEYELTGDRAFRLCAVFALESRQQDPRQEFWNHTAGRDCFAQDYSNLSRD
jgi:type II secretory pathway pseudopilin PulG